MSTDATLNLAQTLAAESVRNPLLPPIGVIIGVSVAIVVAALAIVVTGIVIAVVRLRRGRR